MTKKPIALSHSGSMRAAPKVGVSGAGLVSSDAATIDLSLAERGRKGGARPPGGKTRQIQEVKATRPGRKGDARPPGGKARHRSNVVADKVAAAAPTAEVADATAGAVAALTENAPADAAPAAAPGAEVFIELSIQESPVAVVVTPAAEDMAAGVGSIRASSVTVTVTAPTLTDEAAAHAAPAEIQGESELVSLEAAPSDAGAAASDSVAPVVADLTEPPEAAPTAMAADPAAAQLQQQAMTGYVRPPLENKYLNKEALRDRLWLRKEFKPIISYIGRLDFQKGVQLIKHGIFYALQQGAQFVLLGVGSENHINQEFGRLKQQLNDNPDCHLELGFNEELSHLIYAGSDMVLMPSLYEPCGLTQMIALKYGAVPIVRAVGGLVDTVFDRDYSHRPPEERNGYVFHQPDAAGLESAMKRAIGLWYAYPEEFRQLMINGMRYDYSWNRPAQDYLNIYEYIRHK